MRVSQMEVGEGFDVVAAGDTLGGRYSLLEPVAQGGMGEIWRAEDQVLGRTVAVKVLLPVFATDPELTTRFHAEARTMAALHDPAIVDVYDYGRAGDVAFLVMPYVDGESLRERLHRAGPMAPAAVMTILAQAARALQAAHDRGVVHRDVKPGNLLLRPDGGVVLTDFGIARLAASADLTDTKSIIGTAAYLAPEQVSGGAITAATDVYALGVVAYECLTGRRPFAAETPLKTAMMHERDEPPPLPSEIPAGVRSVIGRALAKAPAQRWPSAAAMAGALAQAAIEAGAALAQRRVAADDGANATAALPTAVATRTDLAAALVRPGPRLSRRVMLAVLAGLLLITGVGLLTLHAAPTATITPRSPGPSSQQPVGVTAGNVPSGEHGHSGSGDGRDGGSSGGSSDGGSRSSGSSGEGPGGSSNPTSNPSDGGH